MKQACDAAHRASAKMLAQIDPSDLRDLTADQVATFYERSAQIGRRHLQTIADVEPPPKLRAAHELHVRVERRASDIYARAARDFRSGNELAIAGAGREIAAANLAGATDKAADRLGIPACRSAE